MKASDDRLWCPGGGSRFHCSHTVLCSRRNSGLITELFPNHRISEWKCLVWLSGDCILSECLTIRIVVWVIVLNFIKNQCIVVWDWNRISRNFCNCPKIFLLPFLLHIYMKYHSQHRWLLNKYSLTLQNIEDALILQDWIFSWGLTLYVKQTSTSH